MSISAKHVHFDDECMWVELSDARILGIPLAWFPKLLHADMRARNAFELSPRGIHWDTLDEDVSIEGLLLGQGDLTSKSTAVA